METQNFATGAIESPKDYRDTVAMATFQVPNAPSSLASYRYNQIDNYGVLMQALEPACVCHSIALLVTDYFYKKTGKIIPFSPRWLDVLVKQYDGQPIDGGTYPRLVMKLLVKYGCATTATVPNDTSLPIAQYRDQAILTPAAYAEAAQYMIPGYIQIGTDPQSLRNAIYFFGLISTLKIIGKEWFTNMTTGASSWSPTDIDPLKIPQTVLSGHETTDFGWNNNLNLLRNSWSEAWDMNGNASYDINAWQPFMTEAWAIAEIPSDLKTYLANLPSPTNFHYNWANNLAYGQGPTDDIKNLQIALQILGLMTLPAVDQLGYYGPTTSKAVLAYQQANGVPTMGLGGHNVGPQTRASLNAKFSI